MRIGKNAYGFHKVGLITTLKGTVNRRKWNHSGENQLKRKLHFHYLINNQHIYLLKECNFYVHTYTYKE